MFDSNRKSPCEGILEMIDFFSQVLHPEQLEEYGYYYVHQLMNFTASAIYMVRGRHLELIKSLGWVGLPDRMVLSEAHEALATKVGVVIYSDLNRYLGDGEATKEASFLMPLLKGEELIGMIVAENWKPESPEEYTYVEAVKKMINLAFYTGIQMTENRGYQQFMDRKFYDQMLLQQLTRLLLQNLEEDQLIQSAVDGVRELTASAITSFFLKDEFSGQLVLRQHTDLQSFRKAVATISPMPGAVAFKLGYHLEKDREALLSLIGQEGLETLMRLGARQVIMLSPGEIQGFITLSDSVTGLACDPTVVELVESIMGTVLIGLENARHYNLLKRQKHELAESLSAMNAISKSLHTLSGAQDLEELASLMLMQLSLHLGLSSAVFCVRSGNAYIRLADTGLTVLELDALKSVALTDLGKTAVATGWVTNYGNEGLEKYLSTDDGVAALLFEKRQMLMLAIHEQGIHTEDAPEALILGFDFEQGFKQYERHFVDVLLHGIAPVFKQLKLSGDERLQASLAPEERLISLLETCEEERQRFWIDFSLCYRRAGFKLSRTRGSERDVIGIGPFEFFVIQEGADVCYPVEGRIEGSLEEMIIEVENLLNACAGA